jgi:hypothetical protein
VSANTPRLKQSIVTAALSSFDWNALEAHLSGLNIDESTVKDIAELIRRHSEFLFKRPDKNRAAKRELFKAALGSYLAGKVEAPGLAPLNEVYDLISLIEAGYAEILQTLEAAPSATLPANIQAYAALRRAVVAYDEVMQACDRALAGQTSVNIQSFRAISKDGQPFSPDSVLERQNGAACMTLMLLGHRNKWFGADGYLILPSNPTCSEEDAYKAGVTELLAMRWKQWQDLEERCRYFGGRIETVDPVDWPIDYSDNVKTVLKFDELSNDEIYDYCSNQRMNARMAQTFGEMYRSTNLSTLGKGISQPVSLAPAGYISAQEAHSVISLSEVLGYQIIDDQTETHGLRLVEWLRGYACLQAWADEQYSAQKPDGACSVISRVELVTLLTRGGLSNDKASLFINLASLKTSSRDLMDQPLIRRAAGDFVVYGPGIIGADFARVTLSAIGSEPLEGKGEAFEKEMLRFFVDQRFAAQDPTVDPAGGTFQFDVMLLLEDHVFLFECKNYSLSGHNPVQAYYFAKKMRSAGRQVRRLSGGLQTYRELLEAKTGWDLSGKVVVPCVLNSLPYAQMGKTDGVYYTDSSSLRRFFNKRDFTLSVATNVGPGSEELACVPVKTLWAGDRPTPQDLIAYLAKPLPLEIELERTDSRLEAFDLGQETVVWGRVFMQAEVTPQWLSETFDVDVSAVADILDRAKEPSPTRPTDAQKGEP